MFFEHAQTTGLQYAKHVSQETASKAERVDGIIVEADLALALDNKLLQQTLRIPIGLRVALSAVYLYVGKIL